MDSLFSEMLEGGHQLWGRQEEMCNTPSGFQDLI